MASYIIFGIGNPSTEYQGTRHNVGSAFAEYAHGQVSDVFVNNSGVAVKKLKAKHKLKNDQIVIAHDDLDIEFGKFKIAFDRSSAGHKGVQSVIDNLKTQKFWRVRIGIANSKLKNARAVGKVPDFVLGQFLPYERKALNEIFENALHDLNNRIDHA